MTGRGITGRDLGENEGQGKGDYSRAAIILSISVKGGGGAIIRGRPLIDGRLLFEEIRYAG